MISLQVTGWDGRARRGRLWTPHGEVETPAFMPVGTAGTVKGLTPDQLRGAGVGIVLANTYHLMLRPGAETVHTLGGVHGLMGWDGPVLTDSGGYQVFSLAPLRDVDDEGVLFRSHIDGAREHLSPQRAMEVQRLLGGDIVMQLDECPPAGAGREALAAAVRRSALWARQCKEAWDASGRVSARGHPQALFGIQQGGTDADLRAESAQRIAELDLPGYAVGGLSVGEGHEPMCQVLDRTAGQLPADRPRYLMGVGEPRDILQAVLRGIDLFDCVLPTRNGRNAQAFTWDGRLRLRNSRWTRSGEPIDPRCECYTCRSFSRGALRHFFQADEMIAPILVSLHNLWFFAELLSAIRDAITAGLLRSRARQWLERMYAAGA